MGILKKIILMMRPQKVFTTREMCLSSNEKNKEIHGRENVRVQLAQSIFVQYNYSINVQRERKVSSIDTILEKKFRES